jgi:N utilization substance protein B
MLAPKFREITIQILFALDSGGDDTVIDLVMNEAKIAKSHAKKALELAQIILKQHQKTDKAIALAVQDYEFNRIPSVEKNILRYALFELMEGADAPLIIKEAVRLARKFSTPEAGAFVHAVLQTLTAVPSSAEAASS